MAKKLEKAGEYEAACDALAEFWPDRSKPPSVAELDELRKAEVLLRIGALAGWLGGAEQYPASQETAKNILTQSIDIFQELGLTAREVEARGDLALCYWREGSYDEARITLDNALKLLGGQDSELKAILLLRAGLVEIYDQKLQDAIQFSEMAAPLVEQSKDHALKGSFHIHYGMIFRRLATPENREDYLDRAFMEYTAAGFHFEEAGNIRYVARVENNLGFLYFTIGRYPDAHHHLERARKLFIKLKDIGTAAQVDETHARTLLAEGRLRQAERMINRAVKTLQNGGQQAVLAEALTTQGTIIARLKSYEKAHALLRSAIEIAQTAGDLEGAGRAYLSIVEELGSRTPTDELAADYRSAVELLSRSQDPATNKRLIACAQVVIDALAQQVERPVADAKTWDGFSIRAEIKKLERQLIARALRDAGGSVTQASKLLGLKHHQSLISLLESRHRDLVEQRSIKKRRRHHLFSKPKGSKKALVQETSGAANQLAVLHVEDNKLIARLVKDVLSSGGLRVEGCVSGAAAWKILKTDARYDVLIVDNNLPGLSGLELILRVRSIPHRRHLPIIMLSGDDVEKEAWRAGVDAYVHKTEVAQLPLTIDRLVKEEESISAEEAAISIE
ncbi:MAG TPA: response regulator [Pyrinomonadaceae bacterium]|nr:response regulator [Pyrinomonadaceae bacterium]